MLHGPSGFVLEVVVHNSSIMVAIAQTGVTRLLGGSRDVVCREYVD